MAPASQIDSIAATTAAPAAQPNQHALGEARCGHRWLLGRTRHLSHDCSCRHASRRGGGGGGFRLPLGCGLGHGAGAGDPAVARVDDGGVRVCSRQSEHVGCGGNKASARHGEEEGGCGLVALGAHPVHRQPAGARRTCHLGGPPQHGELDTDVQRAAAQQPGAHVQSVARRQRPMPPLPPRRCGRLRVECDEPDQAMIAKAIAAPHSEDGHRAAAVRARPGIAEPRRAVDATEQSRGAEPAPASDWRRSGAAGRIHTHIPLRHRGWHGGRGRGGVG
eukprot:scaffold13002_cov125-Isochrysis_galbana.AAC.6